TNPECQPGQKYINLPDFVAFREIILKRSDYISRILSAVVFVSVRGCNNFILNQQKEHCTARIR
ncbi:hypothetical protein WCV54_29530, partial [Klebsiella pneumoniae]|uniref:hypothetical protein n=1 Tax=Klebsiella pneumoniae TaxID=573 RepID=UPI003015BA31